MSFARRRGVHERGLALRTWEVWSLRRWLAVFVVLVTVVYLVAIGLAATSTQWQLHQLLLFAALLACSAGTVELTRRAGEIAGLAKDVYAVWELPVAILLPPLYALVVPILRMVLTQLRIRRVPVYRRVFTAAALGLSYGGASLVFHTVISEHASPVTALNVQATAFILTVAACGVLQWTVNTCLVLTAVKGGDPTVQVRDLIFAREPIQNDSTELCVAVLVTIGVAISPLTLAFALPFVTLLQRSSRHAQLVNDSRIDAKTGLLNPGTWEREASGEVTRAVRTRSALSVALIDIDNFKLVNDGYGHLAGDRALSSIATTIKIFLRDYDLVGRFGGEEFAVLLPQTTGEDARRIAERMRAQIAEVPIEVGDISHTETIKVTVSVGLSALCEKTSQLTDLLAAADVALYHAKHAGRNQVWMTGAADPARAATPVGQALQPTELSAAEGAAE